jgi:hypothetical protein
MSYKGPTRLLQILLSEAAHLIWVLCCKQVIQSKTHSKREITQRWLYIINKRLTDDKIIVTQTKNGRAHGRVVRAIWEDVLKTQGDLPKDWIHRSEYLVGSRF